MFFIPSSFHWYVSFCSLVFRCFLVPGQASITSVFPPKLFRNNRGYWPSQNILDVGRWVLVERWFSQRLHSFDEGKWAQDEERNSPPKIATTQTRIYELQYSCIHIPNQTGVPPKNQAHMFFSLGESSFGSHFSELMKLTKVKVLHGLSLEILASQVVALVGPSGNGKSTDAGTEELGEKTIKAKNGGWHGSGARWRLWNLREVSSGLRMKRWRLMKIAIRWNNSSKIRNHFMFCPPEIETHMFFKEFETKQTENKHDIRAI